MNRILGICQLTCIDVAFAVPIDFPVHDPKPKRRKNSEDQHAGIPRRHLRAACHVAQGLVFASCPVMVVAVAAQFEEQKTPEKMV